MAAKEKSKKAGRNQNSRYKLEGRRDKNKKRRILSMMRRFPKYQLPPGWMHSQVREGDIVRDR